MLIVVAAEDLDTVEQDGTVASITGTDLSGNRVTFAGDLSVINAMCEFIDTMGEITAEVEGWQILSTERVGV
jgi:hypothetical protein